jgi:hypothetical protein
MFTILALISIFLLLVLFFFASITLSLVLLPLYVRLKSGYGVQPHVDRLFNTSVKTQEYQPHQLN